MKVTNISRKIISIFGKTLLPGEKVSLPNVDESNPTIQFYVRSNILSTQDVEAESPATRVMNDSERERIAREAVEQYKQEQEAQRQEAEDKENEVKTVKAMKKKEDLIKKAIGLGIEFGDSDSADVLKEKIINAIYARDEGLSDGSV